MAVPRKKVTRSRRNQRRSHDRIRGASWQECPECGGVKRRHHACPECGYYKGREIIIVELEDDQEVVA
ncbi:MAG: 50S ribosomal protein L32 [Rhodobacteraceae bacterium]|nr:50S ribosomal protein L32 [Paracoccaceae bacterium]MCY4138730.1 50S ribosomal protein L32 [Paracoccaceae bacterium]